MGDHTEQQLVDAAMLSVSMRAVLIERGWWRWLWWLQAPEYDSLGAAAVSVGSSNFCHRKSQVGVGDDLQTMLAASVTDILIIDWDFHEHYLTHQSSSPQWK